MKNEVSLIGRLGFDLDAKGKESGFAKGVLITNSYYKGDNGETTEKSQGHNFICTGKVADNALKYLKKGDLISIDGSLEYNKVKKGDISVMYAQIRVNKILFLNLQKK